MADKRTERLDAIAKYNRVIERHSGKAVRPFREDGYVNLINRYGTQKDQSEQYRFVAEPEYPDELLTMFYEGNGLFSKIIDTPAEEAVKHGFSLGDVKDSGLVDFYEEALDELDWEETAMTAIKWARLFGGSIAVMLINDGRGLEEPLDWRRIKSIDDIRVYDRSVIQPDYSSLFLYDPHNPFRARGSRLGMPEWYDVFSRFGSFRVHESRCLTFQNGILPENTRSTNYQMWGIPEYVRIHRAVRDAEIAHGSAPKLLERSIQAIYKMKDLSQELATDQGEEMLLRRLQAINLARGMMNTMVIDSEGEDYDFKTFPFAGVTDVLSAACNMLSAVTNIPQTILFGQPVGGLSTTDDTAMENYYNFVERIQKRQLRSNLRYLLSVIFQAGVRTGEADEVPKLKVQFNPLWSMSDTEQADLDQKRAQTQQTKAQTAQIYVDMQAVDPSEVRKKLADSEEFDVENMLDEYDDEELFPEDQEPQIDPATGQPIQPPEEGVDLEEHNTDPGTEGSASTAAPAATKLPQDMSAEELEKAQKAQENRDSDAEVSNPPTVEEMGSVGVICVQNGSFLVAKRLEGQGNGLFGGPGGHIERGETPEQAAYRETEEEFGISPKKLILVGYGPKEPETGYTPAIFLCTEWDGEPCPVDGEMGDAMWLPPETLEQLRPSLFPPFADGIDTLMKCLGTFKPHNDSSESGAKSTSKRYADSMRRRHSVRPDGGPGSGNFGHEGRPGETGGSLQTGESVRDGFISDLAGAKNNSSFGKAVEKRMKDMPAGAKIKTATHTVEKISDDEYKWQFKDEPERIMGPDAARNAIMKGVRDGKIEVENISSEDVATALVSSGDLDPKDTNVKIPSMEPESYKGSQIVDVSKEQFQSLREELQKNMGKSVQNDEVKEYLDAIDAYRGTDYVGVVAASAGFSDGYESYSAQMSEEARAKAAAQADAMERFISGADKYEGKVMRALGFDLGGDYDDGTTTRQFEALISKFKPGEELDMGHISSWTTGQSTVNQILGSRTGVDETAERSAQVVFTCPKSKSGVDIGRFSNGFTQGEVAFSKDQKFRVKSVRQNEIGDDDWPMTRYEVEVEEVASGRTDGNSIRKNGNFPEKPIDKSEESATIKSQSNNDYGVPGMKWGEHKAEERAAVEKKFVGKKTSDGIEIKSVSRHAFDRVGERNISDSAINAMLTTQKTSPGNTDRTRCYEAKGLRMVLDTKSGNVVTVMKRRNNR